jgi:ABC-type lipoprotein export system ATPase subunit
VFSKFAFRIHEVSRRYSGDTIHFPGEILIPRGELIGVLGLSGSGKTTLLNLLALMDEADGGNIIYCSPAGEEISYQKIYGRAEKAARFRKEKFGFVFQNDELLDGFSVRDNIQMPYWPAGRQLAQESLLELLASLQLHKIRGFVERNPADLSAGQRSRIGLLRAFSGYPEPEIIFADEPTANVDVHLETEIYRLLERWRAHPNHPERTILLSTHRLDIASRYCTSYIIINKNQSGKSEGKLLSGTRTEQQLRELIVESSRAPRPTMPEAAPRALRHNTQPHSRFKALWKFLFNDFWRYPRAENNFLVTRVAPLLFVLALILFVWLGSFILGIRAGSSQQYTEKIQNDLLWNTEIYGTETQVKELLAESPQEKLFKSYHGFFRVVASIYRNGTSNYDDNKTLGQLYGRTMENEDPLLDRIGETFVWPTTPDARKRALERFRMPEFGIIISSNALVQNLGYEPTAWPTEVPVQFDAYTRAWVPVLAVARDIPGGSFLLSTDVYGAYQDRSFKELFNTETFFLKPAADINDVESGKQQADRLEKWLSGIGVEHDSVRLRNMSGEQLFRVSLPNPKKEFDLYPFIKKNLKDVRDIVSDVRFPKRLPENDLRGHFSNWSVILTQSMSAIRTLIEKCYIKGIAIDTSVQARVAALEESYSIFRMLSLLLLLTAIVLASVLLFTTTWFDSNRKTHSVGVMLGLGISRPFLIAAYALQFYILIGVLLLTYAVADWRRVPQRFAAWIGHATLGTQEGLFYAGRSSSWYVYIGVVLLVVPAIIAGLRFYIYKSQPAELLNFRD